MAGDASSPRERSGDMPNGSRAVAASDDEDEAGSGAEPGESTNNGEIDE